MLIHFTNNFEYYDEIRFVNTTEEDVGTDNIVQGTPFSKPKSSENTLRITKTLRGFCVSQKMYTYFLNSMSSKETLQSYLHTYNRIIKNIIFNDYILK